MPIANELAPRRRAAQLLRVSRRPAASRRKEQVRNKEPHSHAHYRIEHESSTASAAVGAPTSGAAGVRRAPGARTEGSTPGRVALYQRRGIKTGGYWFAGVQAPASRARRKEPDLRAAHVRARHPGRARRSRRRVSPASAPPGGATKSGHSRKLEWPFFFGCPALLPSRYGAACSPVGLRAPRAPLRRLRRTWGPNAYRSHNEERLRCARDHGTVTRRSTMLGKDREPTEHARRLGP